MLQTLQVSLLWFGAIGCTAIGGVYFAFSAFIMAAFRTLDRAAGMAAMQAINEVILRSWFMPLYFGTTLASAALASLAIWQWPLPQSRLVLLAGVLFVVGMFLVTVVFNVPLNDALAAAKAGSSDSDPVWVAYGRSWTLWNHVRTVASIGAGAMYIVAIARGWPESG